MIIDTNRTLELIKSRRSVRNYTSKKVKDSDLEMILEAGRWAPSAHNNQPWKFIVIADKKTKTELANQGNVNALFNRHLVSAPVVIAICAEDKDYKWAIIDCSLAAQNIMLMAWSLGIGSCFVGAFDEKCVKKTLNLPGNMKVIGLIPMGYPAKKTSPPPRLDLHDVVIQNVKSEMPSNKPKNLRPKKGLLSLIFR